jgi:glycosyltransferase domain-containing protein
MTEFILIDYNFEGVVKLTDNILSQCSILIFTKDRAHFLNKQVKYWLSENINILVADASDFKNKNHFSKNVQYFHLPKQSVLKRMNFLSNKLKTKYFVLCADDDFLSISGLKKSLKFLKNNNEYSGCQGRFLTISYPISTPVLLGPHYHYADHKHIEDDNVINRLIEINSFPLMLYCYGVFKKSVLNVATKIWSEVETIEGANNFFEPIIPIASALTGKFRTLNHFHCARRPCFDHPESPVEVSIKNKTKLFQKISTNITNLTKNISDKNQISGEVLLNIYKNAVDARYRYSTNSLTKTNKIQKEVFIVLIRKIRSLLIRLRLHSTFGVLKSNFDDDVNAYSECQKDWERIKLYL